MVCFCLASWLTVKTSLAEIIQLKSGYNIQRPIITRVNDYVKVDMGNGIVITYYLDEINNILADSKSSAEFEEYQLFLNQQLEQIKRIQKMHQKNIVVHGSLPVISHTYVQKVDHQIKDIELTIDNLDKDFSNEFQKLINGVFVFFAQQGKNIKLFFLALLKLVSLNFIVENILSSKITLLVVSSWVIACYPTMILARKFNEKLFWMAWIPVFQIYLLVKLAQKPLWWFLYLFIPFMIVLVPFLFPVQHYMGWFFIGVFIGLVNFLILPTFLWCSIVQLINQPTWWGMCTLIPIANVIIIHKLNQSLFQPKEQYSHRIVPALWRQVLVN